MNPLPNPLVDCVIQHANGNIRIGRLNYKRTHWQLSSYCQRKVDVVWPVQDVVNYRVIPMEFPQKDLETEGDESKLNWLT
jgi:hypothetical protein